MRGWIWLAVLTLSCVLVGPLRAQDAAPSAAAEAVPFELSSDFLVVVEGKVGDVGGLKFIVDTGATRSVIDEKLAAKLSLRRQKGKIMNFDRFKTTEYAEVPAIQVGPLRLWGLRVMVANLLEYSELAKGVDGIVGLDLLTSSQKFTIDYAQKKLYFELATNEIPRAVPGCFIVPVIVQGISMRLVVDSGLAEILLYEDRLQKRPRIRTQGEPETVSMGRLQGRKVVLLGVHLGHPDEPVTAVLIDRPAEPRMRSFDGYLGVASLHARRIDFDFAKMTLSWQ